MGVLQLLVLFTAILALIYALPQTPQNGSKNPSDRGNVYKTASCKDGISTVTVEVNNNNIKAEQGHKHKLQTWRKVDPSMVSQSHAYGIQVKLNTDSTGGLLIDGKVTRYGCGSLPGAAMIVHIKGDWAQIMYTQVFKGSAPCWGIFGRDFAYRLNLKVNGGLEVFNPSFGDVIFGQKGMRSKTDDIFDGNAHRCDNDQNNFWHDKNGIGERQATVILRRKKGAKEAGVQTGTNCGTPSFIIKNIYVLL